MQNDEKNKILEEITNSLLEFKIYNRNLIIKSLHGDSQYMKAVNELIDDLGFQDKWCLIGKTAINYKKWQLLSDKEFFFKEENNYFQILDQNNLDEFKNFFENKSLQIDSQSNPDSYSDIPKNDLEVFKNIMLNRDPIALGEFFTKFYETHKKEISYIKIFETFNIKKDKGYRSLKYYQLNLKYDNKNAINKLPANILDIITKKSVKENLQKKIIKKISNGNFKKDIQEYLFSEMEKSDTLNSGKKLEQLSKKLLSQLKVKNTSSLDEHSLKNIEELLYKIQEILKRGE